ncbi:TIGR04140 family protein [Archaeoglobus fulgidus]|nr:TIGR04140 family protein [Archaeoglobus fulgidus]
MSAEEAKFELRRVLERLGFQVKEMDSEILAEKGSKAVRISLKELGRSELNIPQTEVVFECEEEIYRSILERLRLSRMGG